MKMFLEIEIGKKFEYIDYVYLKTTEKKAIRMEDKKEFKFSLYEEVEPISKRLKCK